jgi:nucleotide-binding universal stress UspA family protein
MKTIAVGVDGSEGGAAALEFAAAEAALRNVSLRIVSAWEVPAAVYGAGFTPQMDAGTLEAFAGRAQQVADDAAATVKELQPSRSRRSR